MLTGTAGHKGRRIKTPDNVVKFIDLFDTTDSPYADLRENGTGNDTKVISLFSAPAI